MSDYCVKTRSSQAMIAFSRCTMCDGCADSEPFILTELFQDELWSIDHETSLSTSVSSRLRKVVKKGER